MLKPSRRIPKAFQRPSSTMSRRLAEKLLERNGPGKSSRTSRSVRKWQRALRSLLAALGQLRMWLVWLAAAACFALILLSLSPALAVTTMRVRREDQRVDIEELEQLLHPFFGKHLLFLSSNLLERTILSADPEVSTVTVKKNFPHAIEITLSMDPIVADVLVGGPDDTEENISAASGSGQYRYLTSRGVYLTYSVPLQAAAEGERLTLRVVDWAVKPVHHQRLLDASVLHDIETAQRILRESFGHVTRSVTLYLRAREFHIQTERLALWLDEATPILKQLDHYRQFLRTLPPGSAGQYIDLRLHDRVVYR